jgi:hypothetical protein
MTFVPRRDHNERRILVPVDPSWFFSSAAQSVAALVGILAGFVTTRIIGSQTEFARKRSRTAHLIAEAKLLIERFSRVNIARYDMHANDYAMAALRDVLAERADDLDDPERAYEAGRHLFSPFTPVEDNRARVAHELEQWKGPTAENVRRSYAIGKAEGRFSKEQRDELWKTLTVERDLIREVVDQTRQHLSACRQHYRDISAQPEASGVTLAALVVVVSLFFVGVLYPLTFLLVTVEQSNAKMIILAVTSVIVAMAAVVAFYFVAVRLRYPKPECDNLAKYCHAQTYSRHLEIYERNLGSL